MYTKTYAGILGLPRFLTLQCAACLFLLLAPAAAHAGDAPLTIRLSSQFTPQFEAYKSIIHFKEQVEGASRGHIRVEVYHSAKLYSDKEVLPAVSSGAVEMGVINLSRFASTIPASDLFQLPFLFNTQDLEKRAISPGGEIRSMIDNTILSQTGARVLWWSPLGPSVFESKGAAMTEPEKIAGKNVRIIGPAQAAFISQCGGLPKDVAGPDIEKAAETREIDIATSSISVVSGRQLWRYWDTVTRTNHTSVHFVAVIGSKFWDSLAAEDRALLNAAALATDADAQRIAADLEANAYIELASTRNMKIVELSKEELQLWRICSSEVLQDYLDKSGPLGEALMQAYGRLQLEAPPATAPVAAAAARRK
jgi:C4-dicarboxylate-binding protein DctP